MNGRAKAMPQPVHMFWIGRTLGPVHRACIRSVQRQGHAIVFHQFSPPVDLPPDIELFDARRLMPEDEARGYEKVDRLTVASNIYRYRMQREGLGLYLDCDIFLLKPVPETDYVLGWEAHNSINNAVLKLPRDSDTLKLLLSYSEDRYFIPPWLSAQRRRELRFRKALGFGKPVTDHVWGTSGPKLLTYVVEQTGKTAMVSSIDVFYPLHHDYLPLLDRDGVGISHLITPNTVGIHLTHGALGLTAPRQGSALYEILAAA